MTDAMLVIANFTSWSRDSLLQLTSDELLHLLDRVVRMKKDQARAIAKAAGRRK